MDVSPKKTTKNMDISSPVSLMRKLEIKSPSSPATSCHLRTAKDHVIQLNKLIHDWKQLNLKTHVIIKLIYQIKSKSFDSNTCCTSELEPLFVNVDEARASFQNILYLMIDIIRKFEVLSKLCDHREPLAMSCSALDLFYITRNILQGYEKEFAVKKLIFENIAHAKDLSKLTMFALAWEYEVHLGKISVDVTRLNMELNLPLNT